MNGIIDLFFPKRCVACRKFGTYLCRNCQKGVLAVESPICPVCQRRAIGGKTHPKCLKRYSLDGLAAGCYYRGPVRDLIRKLKYKRIYDLQDLVIEIMTANLWRYDLPEKLILVPVPLHPRRRRDRGFNQAELFAKRLNKRFKVMWGNVLIRQRYTKPQVTLGKGQRVANVKDAFAVSPFIKAKVTGRSFLLVDDVFTTGSTMAECAKILKKAGAAEVWGMTAALG